jgi:hypothetical protein
MKKQTLFYWLTTGLLAAMMTMSGIVNLLSVPEALAGLKHLGYPAYLSPFLGVAKLLGVLALLVPGFPRLREWAYAGFVFDVVGALYSTMAVGDPARAWLPIPVVLLLIGASYYFNGRRAEAARLTTPHLA